MTIYRKLTFIVADPNIDEEDIDENTELMPSVLVTMGAVGTPFIGGTGILLLDIDETPLSMSEATEESSQPLPLAALEFPSTFSSTEDISNPFDGSGTG